MLIKIGPASFLWTDQLDFTFPGGMADQVRKRFADLTAALEDAAGLASDGQAIGLNKAKIEDLVSQIDTHLEQARSDVSAIQRLVANLD